ncbi:MAG: DUF2066 domain-containing protein [Defluviicoccus sp.]|nr:DUF2066 domain-containing protein [Defluviicoccus sp.]MDE0384256.1 DUF2066 domain-containing protein [Defluviicoccus sp.]
MRQQWAMAAAGALFAWAAAAAFGPAAASNAEAFLVRDVAVDATAANATAARDRALARGHSVAFGRLIARIVPVGEVARVPRLDAAAIAPLVQSFEVDGEKTSRVRYLARLTFRFDRTALRRFLRASGVPFAVARSRPVLVLPVLRSAGTYLLWDRPNPWREAWAGLPRAGKLVPLVSPAGDLQDLRDISARQAVAGESARLRAIAGRYGAESVAVMVASQRRADGSPAALRVSVTTHGADGRKRTLAETRPVGPDATDGERYRAAAARIARRIQEAWKSENLLLFHRGGQLDAAVPVSGLDEWVAISRALADTPSSDGTRVLALSRGAVDVRLRYFGDIEGFRAALRRNDLDLHRGAGGWVLRRHRDGGAGANRAARSER